MARHADTELGIDLGLELIVGVAQHAGDVFEGGHSRADLPLGHCSSGRITQLPDSSAKEGSKKHNGAVTTPTVKRVSTP